MKQPENMTPHEVYESYSVLSAILSEELLILADAEAKLAQKEASFIEQGKTAASAKVLTKASQEGVDALRLRGSVKGLENCIMALKKSQQYFIDEFKRG